MVLQAVKHFYDGLDVYAGIIKKYIAACFYINIGAPKGWIN
jgi:hypothetical protein